MVEDPAKITGPSLVYSNVGARLGVLGRPIKVNAGPELAVLLRAARLLDRYEQRLVDANAHLEQQVTARTTRLSNSEEHLRQVLDNYQPLPVSLRRTVPFSRRTAHHFRRRA